jgi:hypothetical protein
VVGCQWIGEREREEINGSPPPPKHNPPIFDVEDGDPEVDDPIRETNPSLNYATNANGVSAAKNKMSIDLLLSIAKLTKTIIWPTLLT